MRLETINWNVRILVKFNFTSWHYDLNSILCPDWTFVTLQASFLLMVSSVHSKVDVKTTIQSKDERRAKVGAYKG